MKLSKDDKRRLAWLDDHIRGFRECREVAEKIQAEQQENRRKFAKAQQETRH